MAFSLSEVLLLQRCIEGMWCRVDKMDSCSPGGLTQAVGFVPSCGSEAPLFHELGVAPPLGVCSESLCRLVSLGPRSPLIIEGIPSRLPTSPIMSIHKSISALTCITTSEVTVSRFCHTEKRIVSVAKS